jgi:hypothetical protein
MSRLEGDSPLTEFSAAFGEHNISPCRYILIFARYLNRAHLPWRAPGCSAPGTRTQLNPLAVLAELTGRGDTLVSAVQTGSPDSGDLPPEDHIPNMDEVTSVQSARKLGLFWTTPLQGTRNLLLH